MNYDDTTVQATADTSSQTLSSSIQRLRFRATFVDNFLLLLANVKAIIQVSHDRYPGLQSIVIEVSCGGNSVDDLATRSDDERATIHREASTLYKIAIENDIGLRSVRDWHIE